MSVHLLKLSPGTPRVIPYLKGKLALYHTVSRRGRRLFLTTAETHMQGTVRSLPGQRVCPGPGKEPAP